MRSFVLVVAACLIASSYAGEIVSSSFDEVMAKEGNFVALFVNGKDAKADKVLESITAHQPKKFTYIRVDCKDAASKKSCDESGVTKKLPQVFISTEEIGVEAYSGELAGTSIIEYLKFRAEPVKGNRVNAYKSPDQIAKLKKSNRHIVINFYSDNAASLRFKKHFQKCSTAFKSKGGFITNKQMPKGEKNNVKVSFLDVDCDKDEEFCEDYGVLSFPTIGILNANNDYKLQTLKKIKTHEELRETLKEKLKPFDSTKKTVIKKKVVPVAERTDAEAMFNEAVKLSEDGQHKEASVYFRRLVALSPSSSTHGNLATALMRIGNGPINYPSDFLEPYKESLKHYIIAVEMDPTNDAAIEGKKNCLGNIRHRSETAGIPKKEVEAIIKSVLDGEDASDSDDWGSDDNDDDDWGDDSGDDWGDDSGDDWGDDDWGSDDAGKSDSKSKDSKDDDWGDDDWGDDDWGSDDKEL